MYKSNINSPTMTTEQTSKLTSLKSGDIEKIEEYLFFTGLTGIEGTHSVDLKNVKISDIKKMLQFGVELFTWSHSNDHNTMVSIDLKYLQSEMFIKDQELEHLTADDLDPDVLGDTSPKFVLGISVIYEEDLTLLMNWILANK